jgi:hypothetical protein
VTSRHSHHLAQLCFFFIDEPQLEILTSSIPVLLMDGPIRPATSLKLFEIGDVLLAINGRNNNFNFFSTQY